jgi:hypothetical protein
MHRRQASWNIPDLLAWIFTNRQPHRREVCDHHEFVQKPWERYVLMPTKSALPGARRADGTGFGVPEHHGDGSALSMLVQSGNLSLEIWSSGILMKPVAP